MEDSSSKQMVLSQVEISWSAVLPMRSDSSDRNTFSWQNKESQR